MRALQPLILERFGAKSNDLEAGDEGLCPMGRWLAAAQGRGRGLGSTGGGRGKKRKASAKNMVYSECGQWEWDKNATFDIERLIGKMVADGKTLVSIAERLTSPSVLTTHPSPSPSSSPLNPPLTSHHSPFTSHPHLSPSPADSHSRLTPQVPGRTGVKAGTILFKVLWEGYPEEIATWEDADNIHDDYIDAFEEDEDDDGEDDSEDES